MNVEDDSMYIFTCEDRFEDMMCCIYHAWEKALKVGHGCVRLEKRGEIGRASCRERV